MFCVVGVQNLWMSYRSHRSHRPHRTAVSSAIAGAIMLQGQMAKHFAGIKLRLFKLLNFIKLSGLPGFNFKKICYLKKMFVRKQKKKG